MKKRSKKSLDKTAIISTILSVITALATLFNMLLFINAQDQLKEVRKANQGNFILTLNRDFFFDDRMYEFRKTLESEKPLLVENGGTFTIQDIDDYIGIFETMHGLVNKGILDIELIEENFSIFIVDAYRHNEISEYIKNVRKKYTDSEIYGGFEEWGKKFSKLE